MFALFLQSNVFRFFQFDLIDAKELAPLAELNEPILKEAAS